jgi:hypothetical protein
MQHVSFSDTPGLRECNLLSFSLPANSNSSAPDIHCKAVFTVDTSGYVVHSAFEGNLPKTQIDDINYYLSRLAHLAPYVQNSEKALSNIRINISTNIVRITGEGKVNEINYSYTALDEGF